MESGGFGFGPGSRSGFGGSADIRVAGPDDAAAIRAVQTETWLATYPNASLGITRAGLRRFLEGEDGERIDRTRIRLERHAAEPAEGCDFVAVLGGEVVGFTAPFVEPAGRRRIGALYVVPPVQGSGLGHRLLARNLDWHGEDQDVYLTVAAYNERAKRFYARYGFVFTGEPSRDELAIDGVLMPELEMVRRGRGSSGLAARLLVCCPRGRLLSAAGLLERMTCPHGSHTPWLRHLDQATYAPQASPSTGRLSPATSEKRCPKIVDRKRCQTALTVHDLA